jgi:hypothetical protein
VIRTTNDVRNLVFPFYVLGTEQDAVPAAPSRAAIQGGG